MSQYKTGTVTVTNGSAVVVGSGTIFQSNVKAGDAFSLKDSNVVYEIATVDVTLQQFTLSTNYVGVTASGQPYQIARDFTINLGLQEVNAGDVNWHNHMTVNTLRKLDSLLGYIRTTEMITSDAVETTLHSFDLTEGKAYLVEARVVAKESDSGDSEINARGAYIRRVLVHRVTNTDASLQGSVQDGFTVESDAGWDVTIDVSGISVRVRVTGTAGKSVHWSGTISIKAV
jgi:hypothetical protein